MNSKMQSDPKWILICGSRYWKNDFQEPLIKLYNSLPANSIIVVGDATGVDDAAYKLAKERNFPVYKFTAFWNKYGGFAGPSRNSNMLDYADEVHAFTDNFHRSKGTKDCVIQARKLQLPTYVFDLSKRNNRQRHNQQ